MIGLLITLLLQPDFAMAAGTAPTRGRTDAQVRVVMFANFECPFSKRSSEVIKSLLDEMPNDIKVEFHHLPLDHQSHALKSAKTAVCANAQGRFWALYDKFFERGDEDFNDAFIDKAVTDVGLTMPAFETCMKSAKTDQIIAADKKRAASAKITGTPGFVIVAPHGRKRLAGAYPIEEFRDVISKIR